MVRDEIDALPHTLAHLASEGVDGIIVADNRSVDGTRDWLAEADLGCELVVVDDPEVGYYQSRKMTGLVGQAVDRGARWVLPFDADEVWFNGTEARSVRDTLAAYTQPTGALQARLYNHFPTSGDRKDEPNPFLRIRHRDPNPAPLRKVIVNGDRRVVLAQGNHDASGPEPFPKYDTPIEVGHFPWRSPEQFLTKIRNGYEAYQATDLAPEVGAHWRQYGEMLHREGPGVIRDVFFEWFHDPAIDLETRPVPWCRHDST